jgi:phosphoserine phosphatase RsbX
MVSSATGRAPLLEWGVATLTLAGQKQSGDLHLVKPVDHGVLVAVVDGLGHGEDAARAAHAAVRALEHHANEPINELVRRCHEALHGTRGAVMSLALVGGANRTLTWVGVGNVEAVLLPAGVRLLTLGGIVGGELPAVRPSQVRLRPRDIIVLATDGVRSDFPRDVASNEAPQRIADTILTRYGKGTDDALVLVARYLGAP